MEHEISFIKVYVNMRRIYKGAKLVMLTKVHFIVSLSASAALTVLIHTGNIMGLSE